MGKMYIELIKTKLFEQEEVYQALKAGNVDTVKYVKCHDKIWGTMDANYKKRMRLAYYLLYANIDDEAAVTYLFEEELKDRKSNSFQGIGNTLNVLTSILCRYNNSGKYDKMLAEAKMANFDCACGFDKNHKEDDDISALDLMDCIFLSQDLDYKDIMETLVDEWKAGVDEWTDARRTTLIRFNNVLGREQENEEIHKILLKNAISAGNVKDIVSSYNKVIRYYIDIKLFETAYLYLKNMIDTVSFDEIKQIRLFGDILEESFEIICGYPEAPKELWQWAKSCLQEKSKKNMYGNLYTKGIKAAKCADDSYAEQLEKEYIEWKKEAGME